MKTGIIGGSGLYTLSGFKVIEEIEVTTPFGSPSDKYIRCDFAGNEVYFLPRHGRGHRIMPSEINHKANIFGFKKLGIEQIVSVSAVGSLKKQIKPRDILLPDQYFDRTKQSQNHTFFGNGVVAHVSFADPTCLELRNDLVNVARKVVKTHFAGEEIEVFNSGTYVNMEGPAFSTRAESLFYKACGFDVIGMTSLPEAKLCREACICYQSVAMITDYDCWQESEEEVSVEMILNNLNKNVVMAGEILKNWLVAARKERKCGCHKSLANAIVTAKEHIPPQTLKDLEIIIGPYIR